MIKRVEHVGIGLARKRADDLANALGLEQRREPDIAVAGVVVHDRQIARTLLDQRVDQLRRHAGRAEAADHDRRTVPDIRHGFARRRHCLVDHSVLAMRRPMRCARLEVGCDNRKMSDNRTTVRLSNIV